MRKGKFFPYLVLLVVCYGVFVAADDLTVVSTVLTSILYDLDIPVTELDRAAWIVTSYLLGYVVSMPLLGRFSDLFGRRRVYILSMAFFVLGSLFCATARGFGPLLGARVVTAFGGGAVVPIAMAVVSDIFPPSRRAFALGTVGAVDTLGWVFGPLYGAWMTERFDGVVRGWLEALRLSWTFPDQGWRWLFWINLPLGAIAILTALRTLPTSAAEERERTHPFSLLAGGTLGLCLAVLLGLRRPDLLGPAALALIVVALAVPLRPVLLLPWAALLGLLTAVAPATLDRLWLQLRRLPHLGISGWLVLLVGWAAVALVVLGVLRSRREVDYAGGVTLTLFLVALNAAISGPGEGDWLELAQAGQQQAFSPYLWPLLGVAAVALAGFVLLERRRPFPFLDLSLFRIGAFSAANAANLLIGAGLIIAMVDVPLFVVAVQEGSPVQTGLAIAPFTGAIVVSALAGGYLTERLGYRLPGVAGLLLSALGFAAMSQWGPEVASSTMRWHLALCGAGFGLVFAPVGTAVVNAVPQVHTGIASALVIILRLVGMSLGLSGLTAWGLHRLTALMAGAPDPFSQSSAYSAHLTWATATIVDEIFAASALVCLLAVIPMMLLRRAERLERTVHGMR